MLSNFYRIVLVASLAVVAAGCRQPVGQQTVDLPPMEVPVAIPIEREIIDYEEYTGKVMAVERVNLMARVDGYLAEIRFQPGELVKKGDLLFVIDRRPYQTALDIATGQLHQSEARVVRLTKDFKRMEALMQANAGTIEEFDRVLGDLAEARAGVATAKAHVEQAKLNLEFAEVRAPIDGRIGRQMITVGNLVQGSVMPGQASVLSELVSVDKVYVYFDAPERDVLRYRRTMLANQPAPKNLNVDVALFDEVGYPHPGVVDFMAERLDPGTGTQTFRAVLDNPKGRLLAEGMFARVRIAFSKPYPGLVVSERAVVTMQGNKCLYVIDDENKVDERAIELGRVVGPGMRQIKAGINKTDRVAVGNLQRLMPKMVVKPALTTMPEPPTK